MGGNERSYRPPMKWWMHAMKWWMNDPMNNEMDPAPPMQAPLSSSHACHRCLPPATHRSPTFQPHATCLVAWQFHLTCLENDFNLIFTHSRKSNVTKIVRKELKIMQTRFNATIVFFRIDEKKSPKKEFDEMISEMKIIYELFVSYISE